jgi:FtsH-binding integral membrane protein
MAVIGYTTQTDLTKFGSLLMMALIGIIIASFVNWFIGSAALDYIISVGGVLIFTGLIAYDTQRLKRIASGVEYGSEAGAKLAILGATSLYLNFINLFLFLLRLLGRRN